MAKIIVKDLGKSYKNYKGRWGRLLHWLGFSNKFEEHWVLRHIDLEVEAGEAVGLIGVNGAGKSTFLKMITGIVRPTEGSFSIEGRVAALLELGIGFHPEFTGRQNAIMSSQLLGYSPSDIERVLPEIESFAEIGSYIDSPVRTYSSGMQVRLAFAVATAIRPDILIVDEALSVGDIQFQQKCAERIKAFKQKGTTILFVTHDMNALHSLCDRGVVLSQHGCVFQGSTAQAVEAYFDCLARAKASGNEEIHNDVEKVQEDTSAPVIALGGLHKYIDHYEIKNRALQSVSVISESEAFYLLIKLKNLGGIDDPHLGFRIQDRLGLVIYETNTYCHGIPLGNYVRADGTARLKIELSNGLSMGEYTIAFGLESQGYGDGLFKNVLCVTETVGSFTIIRAKDAAIWAGSTNMRPSFDFEV